MAGGAAAHGVRDLPFPTVVLREKVSLAPDVLNVTFVKSR